MVDEAKTFMVEDAQLIFKNFSGEENQYNRPGDRNFNVILDEVVAKQMKEDGWNVKVLQSREEGEPDIHIINIAVKYKVRPPRITLLTSTTRTSLDEESVGILDYAEIETVDLICRGYDWEVGDKTGVKAYLQTMFVTIREDALERKYAGIHPEEA